MVLGQWDKVEVFAEMCVEELKGSQLASNLEHLY